MARFEKSTDEGFLTTTTEIKDTKTGYEGKGSSTTSDSGQARDESRAEAQKDLEEKEGALPVNQHQDD